MEKYEPISIIQKCQISEGHFDLLEFNRLMSELNAEQFDKFCKAIRHLTLFTGADIGAIDSDNYLNIRNSSE